MSAPAEMPGTLHPAVRAAAEGELPSWARAGPERRGHMARVAGLLRDWAKERGAPPDEVARWAAAGWLHDALRDAPPAELRPLVPAGASAFPDPLLHGPAAAQRLRAEGVADDGLLRAVAYHSVGDAGFDDLGLATFCADFLEPGRGFRPRWRARLRRRMPDDLANVAREIVAARIRHHLDESMGVHPRTVSLWNRLVEGAG
ncbi:MAG TPA: HD domain-containing protein [Longimicrobiales bacterium]|nr:HD domain-containing protein [Longimicrobiales bacterium]